MLLCLVIDILITTILQMVNPPCVRKIFVAALYRNNPMSSLNPLEIAPQDVKQKLDKQENFVLLDCREQDEFDLVHIEQARLLPLSELEQRASELENQETIVYCHHGARSMRVTRWLLNNGFSDVKSMAGGIDLWAEQIDSEMTRY